MTLNEGSIPRVVTAGDGSWTDIEVTDVKFNVNPEVSPPRWRREGNTIRLAGELVRVGEAALAEAFATLPAGALAGYESGVEGEPNTLVLPVVYQAKGAGARDAHGLELEKDGKLRFLVDPAEGAIVILDGVTWTTD